MYVLSFVNQKGGCGKTTASVNLAGALASMGARVLLVDLDPQAHATLALGQDGEADGSAVDVLLGNRELRGAWRNTPGGIALLAAREALVEVGETLERTLGPERVLRGALESVAGDFDFALLDCPPRTDGILTANALSACDASVLVVETSPFALQGAVRAKRLLENLRSARDLHFEIRVLATLFESRTRLAREILIALSARFDGLLFNTAVRSSVRLREAASRGVPVQVLDPNCRASADFAALAEEVAAAARFSRRLPRRMEAAPSGMS